MIGDSGLTDAIHEVGYIITDHDPEYVVLGETNSIDFEQITTAIRLVSQGAHFIATNPDPAGPTEDGMVPACGAMAALIERASGVSPFFIGKPNPLMMRLALNYLGVHSEHTVMIGDRMDTDIVTGIESGMETILVLSGVTREEGTSAASPTSRRGLSKLSAILKCERERNPDCPGRAARRASLYFQGGFSGSNFSNSAIKEPS